MKNFEILQWVYVAIFAPLLGAIGGWLRSWWSERRSAKRREKHIVARLSGFPPESKAVLIDFYQHGTHTRRADPGHPAIRVLIKSGYMSVGPGGGTYNAVDSYLIIRPEVWEVMDSRVVKDAGSIAMVRKQFLEPSEHA